jgi:hypothetical protein
MGKTNDPLVIIVDLALYNTPEVQELREQGHDVTLIGLASPEALFMADGFLGAKQWRMTPELIKYLPMAIKAIRKEKKDAGRPRGPKVKKARKPKQEVAND